MNYNFEYETQGTTNFLVYKKRECDVLDSVTIGMVSNNKIEGVIPFMHQLIDKDVYFKYNVSSFNTLKDYFSGVVSKKRFLTVMKSLLKSYAAIDEYMIEQSAIVLESEYIFVNPKTAEAQIILVPYKKEMTGNIVDFLRLLLCSVHYDETEDRSYIASILSFLNANQFFDVLEFQKFLEEMLEDINVRGSGGSNISGMVATKIEVPETAIPNKKPDGFTKVEKINPETNTTNKEKIDAINESEKNVENTNVVTEKKKGLFGLKKKEEKVKKSLFGKKDSDVKKQQTVQMSIPGREPSITIPNDQQSEQINTYVAQSTAIQEQDVHLDKTEVVQQDFGKTVDLRAYSKGTEVLTQKRPQTEVLGPSPYFIVMRTRERFEITKDRMKIGSDASQNDFCIHGNTAISRAHAIIHYKDKNVYIEDNYSTNGTKVDGEKIKPGVLSKVLTHGTRIHLGDEELEMKLY